MDGNSICKQTLLFATLVFNVLFVSIFFIFLGFLFGSFNSQKTYNKGVSLGYENGKCEVYLDLESRKFGKFDSEKNKFDFYEPLKKGK